MKSKSSECLAHSALTQIVDLLPCFDGIAKNYMKNASQWCENIVEGVTEMQLRGLSRSVGAKEHQQLINEDIGANCFLPCGNVKIIQKIRSSQSQMKISKQKSQTRARENNRQLSLIALGESKKKKIFIQKASTQKKIKSSREIKQFLNTIIFERSQSTSNPAKEAKEKPIFRNFDRNPSCMAKKKNKEKEDWKHFMDPVVVEFKVNNNDAMTNHRIRPKTIKAINIDKTKEPNFRLNLDLKPRLTITSISGNTLIPKGLSKQSHFMAFNLDRIISKVSNGHTINIHNKRKIIEIFPKIADKLRGCKNTRYHSLKKPISSSSTKLTGLRL